MTATALAITRHILPLRCCGQRGATHHSGMVVAQPCSLAFVGLRAFVNLVRGSATVWERSGLSAPQPHSKVPQGPSAPLLRKDRSFVGQPCCNMAPAHLKLRRRSGRLPRTSLAGCWTGAGSAGGRVPWRACSERARHLSRAAAKLVPSI